VWSWLNLLGILALLAAVAQPRVEIAGLFGAQPSDRMLTQLLDTTRAGQVNSVPGPRCEDSSGGSLSDGTADSGQDMAWPG